MAATQTITGAEPGDARDQVSSAGGASGGAGNGERFAPAAPLTDDQILGIDTAPQGEAPRDQRAGQEPGRSEQGGEGSREGAARAQRAEEIAANAAEPPELKQLFEANPQLRRAWQAERAYREVFPTVAEARELKKIFPTLADARTAAENLGELQQLDRWFFSENPADRAELVASLHRLDPQAFRGMAQAFPQVLARLDPEAYRADTAMRLEATLADVRSDAGTRGDQTLVAAVDLLAQRIFSPSAAGFSPGRPGRAEDAAPKGAALKVPSGAPDLREAALARREQALVAREAAAQQQSLATFYESANAAVVENVLDAIKSQVAELVPEELSESARNRVVGEIYREIDATLRGNQGLSEQIRQSFRQGALDPGQQQAVVNLVVGRARHLLPQVAKRVVSEWTSSVLAASRQKSARQRAAAARVDITGGGAPATVGRPILSPRDVDYGRLSDMDILNL